MNLLCIDPGTTHSGVVCMDGADVLSAYPDMENYAVLDFLIAVEDADLLLIEMIDHMGMPAGKDLFETCVWIGRFIQAFEGRAEYVYRRDVKLTLCNNMRAKDANIRRAILDRYPATGGGKTPQIGTKKEPGPLFGVARHSWSALAIGITWLEKQREK